MQIGGEIIFLSLAIAIYIFIVINRICQCFEVCSQNKMMSGMYTNADPVLFNQILNKSKET